MAETEYKRLFIEAQDRAFFGFLALIQRAMQEAERNAGIQQAGARTELGQSALSSLRHFLRQDGNVFLRRVETLLRTALERAMQTMYVDLRGDMRKLSADTLSLIDDETVNQQLEVGRLAQRMREANEEGIGRLNVIISQLHGRHDAKERENPFRPYLLARVLYEATRDTAGDDVKARLLYEQLGNAVIPHIPGYYSAIRQVFESFGVQGQFIAQQSRAAHFQRYYGAPPGDPHFSSAHAAANMLPGLQRLAQSLQLEAGAAGRERSVGELLRTIVSPPRTMNQAVKPYVGGKAAATAAAVSPLVAQLRTCQKQLSEASVDKDGRERNQLLALREQLPASASPSERMTVDVVGMLFEFILNDEQIAPQLRKQIAGLQIPLLKAALLDADLLHDEAHPARRLLNRLASAAAGVDLAAAEGRQLGDEIERVVTKVLRDFDTDVSIFAACLAEFENFLVQQLRGDEAQSARCADALELAEKLSILLTNVTAELCDLLMPLNLDKRISDFIIRVWPHVLVRSAWADRQRKIDVAHADSTLRKSRAVLPDLVWSVQTKQSQQERSELIRLLPDLVRRVNLALQLIRLPQEESAEIMDLLVEMHMQVLRGPQNAGAGPVVARDELVRSFARLVIHWDRVSWGLAEPPQARPELIEEAVAHHGVQANLNLGLKTVAASAADREFLAQTYLLGTRVELRQGDVSQADDQGRPAQLVWLSTHRSLYLFRQDDGELAIYTCAALLEALRDGAIVPVEYAPVFERAIESLLYGAEKFSGRTA